MLLEKLQHHVDDLQAEVRLVMAADRERLMLRQIAAQAMNKVARFCVPSINTPYAARFATLDAIQRHKQHDAARVKAITTKYPHLVVGVNALSDCAIAHPSELENAEGKVVSIELLQELVDWAFKGTIVEGEVQEVLDCLDELREKMNEDLFVDTSSKP